MSFTDSVKSYFSSKGDDDGETLTENTDSGGSGFASEVKKLFPKLTLKQRLIGFAICLGLAGGLALLGCLLGNQSTPTLAVLFTLGSAAGICSTFFIIGPIQQVKKMYDKSNVAHTVIKISCVALIIGMVVLVYCATFWWKVPLLSILFCVVLFGAIIVYAITLIPFATTIIAKGAKTAYSGLTSS